MPEKDLRLTIKFYSYNTGTFPFTSTLLSTQVVPLVYNSLGGTFLDTWTASVPCPDSVTRTATIHCKQVGTGDPYGTVNGSWPIGVSPYNVGPGGGGLGSGEVAFLALRSATGTNSTYRTYSCEPFSFEWGVFNDDGNGFSTVPVALYSITDPTPTTTYVGTCCPCFMTVGGCGGGVVPGATYSVYTDSTKVSPIASGTTDGNGLFSFDADFCGVGLYRTISHPRFATVSGSHTYVGTETDNLSTPASGYSCSATCGTPLPNTLHATHPKFGAISYAHSGSNWAASVSYAYPGNGGACSAKTVTITCTWNGDTTYTESWKYDGSNCPDDSGANTATVTWTAGTRFCPPAFSYPFTHTPTGAAEIALYGTSAMTNTFTE